MKVDPHVVTELRRRFMSGATPSRLIMDIIDWHGDDAGTYGLIQSYFQEAFGVHHVQIAKSVLQICEQDALRYAHLNTHLLYEMLLHRGDWDDRSESEMRDHPAWYDSVELSGEFALVEHARNCHFPEFGNVWEKLSDEAKEYLHQTVGNLNYLHQMSTLLARLTEQLQHNLVANKS